MKVPFDIVYLKDAVQPTILRDAYGWRLALVPITEKSYDYDPSGGKKPSSYFTGAYNEKKAA